MTNNADSLAARHVFEKQAALIEDNRALRLALENCHGALDKAEAAVVKGHQDVTELRRRVSELELSKPPQFQ